MDKDLKNQAPGTDDFEQILQGRALKYVTENIDLF